MQRPTYDAESFAAGASASLNKSIKDIERLAYSLGIPTSPNMLRQEFRERLRQEFLDTAFRWYRIGFRRGHKTCYKIAAERGSVPRKVSAPTRMRVKGLKFKMRLNSDLAKR